MNDDWVSSGRLVTIQPAQTLSAPDLFLTRGALVKVQVVDAKTRQPLKLNEGQRGYVFPVPVASETRTPVLDNPVVRFTTDGKAEFRVPSGSRN